MHDIFVYAPIANFKPLTPAVWIHWRGHSILFPSYKARKLGHPRFRALIVMTRQRSWSVTGSLSRDLVWSRVISGSTLGGPPLPVMAIEARPV